MAFNWTNFLVTLGELTPVIVAGVGTLKSEETTATKTQLATDSLNLATGLSQALLAADPADQQLAAIASQLTASVITATSLAHSAAGLPSLGITKS